MSKRTKDPEWHNNRAVELAKTNDVTGACHHLFKATSLNPCFYIAWRNLGLAQTRLCQYRQAERAFQRAISLKPDYSLSWCGLGCVRQYQGDYDAAMQAYERALLINPGCANSHTSRAYLRLLQGDYARGFAEYSWRWQADDHARYPALPRWRGERMPGKRLLVHTEQGFGDTIMFSRYLPMLRESGARIAFVCDPEILPLLKYSQPDWADEWFAGGGPVSVSWDAAISLGDLPEIAEEHGQSNLRESSPYIKGAVGRFAAPSLRPRVGLVWRGRPTHNRDRERSMSLEQLAPLVEVDHIEFVSMQPFATDLEIARSKFRMENWGARFDKRDFIDASVAISCLDLLITVDTSLAHLAGAMGHEVWVLIQYSPDWRWGLLDDSTQWYRSMRLFRQKNLGDWSDPIGKVRDHLGYRFNRQ